MSSEEYASPEDTPVPEVEAEDADADFAPPAVRKRGRPPKRRPGVYMDESKSARVDSEDDEGNRGIVKGIGPNSIMDQVAAEVAESTASQGEGGGPYDSDSDDEMDEVDQAKITDVKTFGDRTYGILNDEELLVKESKRGNAKVDRNGHLLGGREYKMPVFELPQRTPGQLYALSIEVARVAGFKDSLYLFRRQPLLTKLNVSQPEKEELIEQGFLSSNLRSRAVIVVNARAAYKVLGALIVDKGRFVTDDYYEERSRRVPGRRPGSPAVIDPNNVYVLASMSDIPPRRHVAIPPEAYMRQFETEDATAGGADDLGEPAVSSSTPALLRHNEQDAMHPAQLKFGDYASFDAAARSASKYVLINKENAAEASTNAYLPSWAPYRSHIEQSLYSPTQLTHRTVSILANMLQPIQFGSNGLAPFTPSGIKVTQTQLPRGIDADNWVDEYAKLTQAANDALLDLRSQRLHPIHTYKERVRPRGVYDPYTNLPMVPASSQPTGAEFIRVSRTPRVAPTHTQTKRRIKELTGKIAALKADPDADHARLARLVSARRILRARLAEPVSSAAAAAPIASYEYVLRDNELGDAAELLPGQWVFGPRVLM